MERGHVNSRWTHNCFVPRFISDIIIIIIIVCAILYMNQTDITAIRPWIICNILGQWAQNARYVQCFHSKNIYAHTLLWCKIEFDGLNFHHITYIYDPKNGSKFLGRNNRKKRKITSELETLVWVDWKWGGEEEMTDVVFATQRPVLSSTDIWRALAGAFFSSPTHHPPLLKNAPRTHRYNSIIIH